MISAGVDEVWSKPMPTKKEAIAIINRIRSTKLSGAFSPTLMGLLQCGAGFGKGKFHEALVFMSYVDDI